MRTRKAIASLALVAGIGIGSVGTATAGERFIGPNVGPEPVTLKAFTFGKPAGYTIAPNGRGSNMVTGQTFCIEHYGCERQPGEGGGPRWAHLRIALDMADGEWNGLYFGRSVG